MQTRAQIHEPKKYRIVCRYRQWVGRPDPSNFGQFTVASDDPSWLHEEATRLKRNGHVVYKTQRWNGAGWTTI